MLRHSCRLVVALTILGMVTLLHAKSRNDDLVDAARGGNLNTVKSLLDQGLAIKGNLSDQAILAAAEFGKMDVVEEFFSRKILPRRNIQDELFLIAVFKGNQSIATALMDDGLRLDSSVKNRFFPGGRLGGRALLTAAHANQDAMVQLLLDFKVDPNTSNDTGHLMHDVWHDQQGPARPIGSNANDEEIDDTPLIGAARSCAAKAIKVLLDAGANIHARNKAGVTALMAAASPRYGMSPEVVELLLKGGANPMDRDRHGRDALDFAKERLERANKEFKEMDDRINSQKNTPSDRQKEHLDWKRRDIQTAEKVVEQLKAVTADKDKKPGIAAPAEPAGRKFDLPAKVHCKQQIEAFSDENCTQAAGMFNPPVELELVQFLEKSAAYQVGFRQPDGKEIKVYCRKKDIEYNCELGGKDPQPAR
jgi:ankyrin repeat protein